VFDFAELFAKMAVRNPGNLYDFLIACLFLFMDNLKNMLYLPKMFIEVCGKIS